MRSIDTRGSLGQRNTRYGFCSASSLGQFGVWTQLEKSGCSR